MDQRPFSPGELRELSRPFTVMGAAAAALLAVPFLLQFLVLTAAGLAAPALLEDPFFPGLLGLVSTYGAGLLVFWLILRRVSAPPRPAPAKPLPPGGLARWFAMALAALYASNLLTLLVLNLVRTLRGRPVANPVDAMAAFPALLRFLLLCVAAPLAEEWMFRGLLLRRLLAYGEGFAALASALIFALFHGTFSQYLYAFSVGFLFACLVLRTGCLWQAMLLHGAVNFVGGFLPPLLEGGPGMALLGALVLAVTLLGLTLLVPTLRNMTFCPGVFDSPGVAWRLLLENPGMVLFLLLSLFLAVSALISL